MKFIILLSLFILNFKQEIRSQEIASTLSKLYFNADITHLDTSLITFLKKNNKLTYYSINMWADFNLDGESKHITQIGHKFPFTYNPFFLPDSIAGFILVCTEKNKTSEKVIFIDISFTNLSKDRSDSFFKLFANMLSKYYSKFESDLRLGNNPTAKYFKLNSLGIGATLIIKQETKELYSVDLDIRPSSYVRYTK
jgi:hypothetical protein